MNKIDSTLEVLINWFLMGIYTQETSSPEKLLEGFRATTAQELKIRRSHSKQLRGSRVCKILGRKSSPFDVGIERIRSMFTVDDIIKLLTISPKYYDSDEFKKVVAVDIDFAKDVYGRYIEKCKSGDHFPADLDQYLPLFKLHLDEHYIYLAFGLCEVDILKNILLYTNMEDIEIVYRHYDHLLSDKERVIQLLDTLYETGIHVWTHDGTTSKLLKQCSHRNQQLSLWKSPSDTDDFDDFN